MSGVKEFREMSYDQLCLRGGTSRDQYELANQELHRRYLSEIGKQTESLVTSSGRLEDLTKVLRNLTLALIVLTIAAAVVPVGIEVWHISHVPEVKVIALPPAAATAISGPSRGTLADPIHPATHPIKNLVGSAHAGTVSVVPAPVVVRQDAAVWHPWIFRLGKSGRGRDAHC